MLWTNLPKKLSEKTENIQIDTSIKNITNIYFTYEIIFQTKTIKNRLTPNA